MLFGSTVGSDYDIPGMVTRKTTNNGDARRPSTHTSLLLLALSALFRLHPNIGHYSYPPPPPPFSLAFSSRISNRCKTNIEVRATLKSPR